MPTSRGRKKTKRTSSQRHSPIPPSYLRWKRHWKKLLAIAGAIAAIVGFASAVATFVPRVQFEVSPQYVLGSPFPASITIINQFWPLDDVSFALRICRAQNAVGGKFIGLKNCSGPSKGAGDISTPQWEKHQLATDERWDIQVGGNIAFQFDAVTADIRLVLKYWPWLIPGPWFMGLEEKEARLVLYTKPDGSRFWSAIPVN